MTDGDALLAAVIDRPDDDTPRLVLADWLDDRGEAERAALIRRQVYRSRGQDAGRLRGRLKVRQWFAPWWRTRSSWSYCNPQWDLMIATRPNGRDPDAGSMYVRRGFVAEARLLSSRFPGAAADLFATQPVTRVVFNNLDPQALMGGWLWIRVADDQWPRPTYGVHRVLFGMLRGGSLTSGAGEPWRAYPTRDEAVDDLSAAACRYGRWAAKRDREKARA